MRISSAKANYAGTVPVIGRLVGAAGIVSNTIKLVAHTIMKDSKASSDKEKIVSSWKRAIPLYGLKYSFDRLAEEGVSTMKGTTGTLDKLCIVPVLQQFIGVPRLAYHSLSLIVFGPIAATTSILDSLIEKYKDPSVEGKISWVEVMEANIFSLHSTCMEKFASAKPKAVRDLYRSIPVVGSCFSLAYIKSNETRPYDKM